MRDYQETIVSDIISNFNIGKPYVLGSCPSSGKTEMAIEALIRLIEAGHVNRVLILAHSTNVLKENFYNRLIEYFNEDDIEVMRGQKDYNYDARIQVMIPQNIKHVTGEFELVITDEAQHNVLAEDGNYGRIIEMVQPKFQLLLTGTPSKFVRENALSEGDAPYYINTVGMDTIGFEHFHDVRFDLIRSAYGFTNADYNQYNDLLTDIKFSFDETERTINNVIIGAVRNIALRNGIDLPKDSDFILEGRKLIKSGKFGKTLIMCRSIEQANQTSQIISKLFGVNVRVSQSQNDSDSRELDNFKDGKFNFLCVVKRAREGYDDNKVLNLIDITMTHNIDLIYQMFCRVVRLDKSNPNPKLYIKVTSNAEGMPEYTMNIMTAALMLGSTENLARFNGSNFRDIEMPRIQQEEIDEDDIIVNGVVDIVDTDGNVIRRRNINELMALDLIQMFSEDHKNLVNGNDRYAMTTLGEALRILKGDEFISPEETFDICIDNNLTYSTEYLNYRKKNSNLNLHSHPWDVISVTQGKYFSEIRKKLGINDEFLSPEETFNICVDNKLISHIKYMEYLAKDSKINLRSNPWITQNQTQSEYFNNVRDALGVNEDFLSPEETLTICINNAIISEDKYSIFRKTKEDIKLHSNPWKVINKTSSEYFSNIRNLLNLSVEYITSEDTVKICVENNLINLSDYNKFRYSNQNLKLHSTPWKIINTTYREYFDKIKELLKISINYITSEETVNVCVVNKLISSKDYRRYKKNNPHIKLRSNPWVYVNKTTGDYFNDIKKIIGVDEYISFDDVFNICVKNKLDNTTKYKEYRIKNKNLKLYSNPWTVQKKTNTEYFDEVRKVIYEEENNNVIKFKPSYLGEFSEMNKKWNTSNSNTNHKRYKKDNTEWKKYHSLYSKAREKWTEIPYVEISKKLKERPEWIIGDFGCGENLLSKEIKNKVLAFDHVAIDDSVISCDLSCIPMDNDVLDVAVFSLALMYTNYDEYLKEANRLLKPMGLLMIAEPRNRWSDDEGNLDNDRIKTLLDTTGFRIMGDIRMTESFIYISGIKM